VANVSQPGGLFGANGAKLPERVRDEALRQLGGHRIEGEWWLPVKEAAGVLGLSVAQVHRRIDLGHVGTRTIGDEGEGKPHVRVADLDRFSDEGRPHPHLEDSDPLHVPEKWLMRDGCAFVALRPMTLGDPARPVHAGDIFAADEGGAIGRQVSSGEAAALPLDRGVLGIVRRQQARIAELEAQLAEKA
jgi:hypothetical protein